jgi:hypothetical protein
VSQVVVDVEVMNNVEAIARAGDVRPDAAVVAVELCVINEINVIELLPMVVAQEPVTQQQIVGTPQLELLSMVAEELALETAARMAEVPALLAMVFASFASFANLKARHAGDDCKGKDKQARD